MSEYLQQEWTSYNENATFQQNVANGAVATAEKMEHMEEGIAKACNTKISIMVSPGSEDMCTVTEKDGKKVYDVISSTIEPKQFPIEISISSGIKDSTTVTEDKDSNIKRIDVVSSAIEPKHLPLEVYLISSDTDMTKVEDKDGKRRVTINTSAINNFLSKPTEKEIIIDIDSWSGESAPFESEIILESITPSNVVRFTKGSKITATQLKAITDCGIEIVENLNGSIKAVANISKPDIDIPIHVTIV